MKSLCAIVITMWFPISHCSFAHFNTSLGWFHAFLSLFSTLSHPPKKTPIKESISRNDGLWCLSFYIRHSVCVCFKFTHVPTFRSKKIAYKVFSPLLLIIRGAVLFVCKRILDWGFLSFWLAHSLEQTYKHTPNISTRNFQTAHLFLFLVLVVAFFLIIIA